MLLIHDAKGFVQQTVEEPVDEGYVDRLAEFGFGSLRVDDDWMAGRSIASIYVDRQAGEAKPRASYPASIDRTAIAADGVEAAIVTGLLDGEIVLINGRAVAVTGGTLTLKSGHPGIYQLVVAHWPYADWSAVVVTS